jgi:uncharacterized protein (DUF2132 family)
LHGITLETIVTELLERHELAEMGRRIPVRGSMQNISLDLAHLRAQYEGTTFLPR